MRDNPVFMLLAVSALLWIGAQSWRRKKIKRAARDLPTRMMRLLGPEPEFEAPEDAPGDLADFIALQSRTRRIEWILRGLALLWLGYVLFLMMQRGMMS